MKKEVKDTKIEKEMQELQERGSELATTVAQAAQTTTKMAMEAAEQQTLLTTKVAQHKHNEAMEIRTSAARKLMSDNDVNTDNDVSKVLVLTSCTICSCRHHHHHHHRRYTCVCVAL